VFKLNFAFVWSVSVAVFGGHYATGSYHWGG